MTEISARARRQYSDGGALRAALVPLTLLVVSAVLWTNPTRFVSPIPPPAIVPPWATDTSPVRHPTLKPELKVAGFTYKCSDCHRLFKSPPETTRSLTMHTDVVLKHGINTRCFNCHNINNRDTYVDDYGREIPTDQPQLVCAKCHGPVYRDWLHGSHGRTNGYWDTSKGPMLRRKCIECHDPHEPPFAPMHPAPSPDTLRMGNQQFPPEHAAVRDPLRIYHQPGAEGETPLPEPNAGDQPETRKEP